MVEDAHSLRNDIVEMLEFEGYDVFSAENGYEGLKIAHDHKLDLIISDIMMPIMDGMELLEALRQDARTATIPLIFLTARTDRVDMRHGMELGADDFVTKPFHASELLASISTQFRKRELIDQATERRLDDLRDNIILSLPHELRTPLNSVLGFSNLLIADSYALSADRVREMAGYIQDAGQRLYALVENYLTYAHIEIVFTDPRRIAEVRSDRAMQPDGVIVISARQAADRYHRPDDISLTLTGIHSVAMGEAFLKKIMDEVIGNAFKFSKVGDVVEVHDSVQTNDEGARYVIRVTDHGLGLTPAEIERIGAYMQFSRRLQEQQGMGMGLIIARRLVELHGGEMTLMSEPGQGLTVTMALPIHPPVA